MKKLLVALGLSLLMAGTTASAATWELIQDNYIGGKFKNNSDAQKGGDVISAYSQIDKFDIDSMIVDIDNYGNVKITIATDYNPADSEISHLGTDYGDLFISTDGWAPNGTEANSYINDTFYSTGTTWEYVFDTSTQNLYATEDRAYILSNNIFGASRYSYRKRQLVQINEDKLTADPKTQGIFETGTDEFGNNFLTYYSFNLSDMGLDLTQTQELAFRWGMTCANDVIEGSVTWEPVPEPGTILLFGLGILGVSAIGRRKISG